jgi:GR25 family glycosyltransferase involved in LPS biosynthesis
MDIKNVYYINLSSRTDRNKHMKIQLQNLGWKGKRVEAVELLDGRVGCTLSHIKCLKMAIEKNLDYIIILEDDIDFLDPSVFLNNFYNCLNSLSTWDVILIAGNNIRPYTRINDSCVKIVNTQTTTGYMVKNHYFPILLENMKEGLTHLLKNPKLHIKYAIDKYWFLLQEKDNWYLITPLTVSQLQGYSNIEERETNYTNLMLLLDKPFLYNTKS